MSLTVDAAPPTVSAQTTTGNAAGQSTRSGGSAGIADVATDGFEGTTGQTDGTAGTGDPTAADYAKLLAKAVGTFLRSMMMDLLNKK